MIAVITPQFENTEYSVPEDGGSVEICIAIQPDQLDREVVVTLQTVDNTATGTLKYSAMFDMSLAKVNATSKLSICPYVIRISRLHSSEC